MGLGRMGLGGSRAVATTGCSGQRAGPAGRAGNFTSTASKAAGTSSITRRASLAGLRVVPAATAKDRRSGLAAGTDSFTGEGRPRGEAVGSGVGLTVGSATVRAAGTATARAAGSAGPVTAGGGAGAASTGLARGSASTGAGAGRVAGWTFARLAGRGLAGETLAAARVMLAGESSQDTVPLGTGIGLRIVRDFVRLHGGEVTLETEPGRGTQVHFTVPEQFVVTETVRDQSIVHYAGSRLAAHADVLRREIDRLLYGLHGLTEEEIRIVEGVTNCELQIAHWSSLCPDGVECE